MQFDCFVETMRFDEATSTWELLLKDGRRLTTRFVLMGVGLLSVPTLPTIDGVESFEGESFHPFDWPAEPLDLTDKRVAIIGTGATSIQIIPEVAKEAAHLTVFQRRANWAAPLNNGTIDEAEMAEIRRRYDEIFENCARSPSGFEHMPDRRGFYKVPREERLALWDRLYDGPGFGIWLQNFAEIFMNEEANAEFSEYIAERIRGRVDDPAVAEKLIPKDHGFGIQRVPMETGFYEAFNQDNVTLIDASDATIECVTPSGVRTRSSDGQDQLVDHDFDIIVYATGFDAFTGAYDRIDIEGIGGEKLRAKWAKGPVTYLGLMVHGFPNFLMIPGPQGAVTNFPRAVETAIDWVTPLLEYVWENGHGRLEATDEAEQAWFEDVVESYKPFLLRSAQSWITGYNSNLEGHEYGNTRYNLYNWGGPKYMAHLQEVADKDYDGISFS